MHGIRRIAGILAIIGLLAGCGAGGRSTPSASAPSPETAPTVTPRPTPLTVAPTTAPTPASTPVSTPVPSDAGPVVLISTLYPYRLTVPSGPTNFVPAPVSWDGVRRLGTDTLMADVARVPGAGTVWLAMIDTDRSVDDVATDIEAKFRRWHGCKLATDQREFGVGALNGVAFVHTCGEWFARAVVVGNGHMLVAFSPTGIIPTERRDQLIELLGGLEWTR